MINYVYLKMLGYYNFWNLVDEKVILYKINKFFSKYWVRMNQGVFFGQIVIGPAGSGKVHI